MRGPGQSARLKWAGGLEVVVVGLVAVMGAAVEVAGLGRVGRRCRFRRKCGNGCLPNVPTTLSCTPPSWPQ
jgi:hypothetical protein